MRSQKNAFDKSNLIHLKDKKWLARQKHAGKCVASVLNNCASAIASEKKLSLKDLEQIALKQMDVYKCTPTFKGYNGFPSAVCASVNEQVVHGIVTDYVMQPGDLVSIDLGATYEEAIADAARTWIYGEPKSRIDQALVETTKLALDEAIRSIKIGNRLGCVGNAISKVAKNSGFGLITKYGGHGLEYSDPHCDPFVENKSNSWEGIRIEPGLAIAIEPMLVIGEPQTKVLDDGWTVVTPKRSAHFEDSVTIMKDGIHIITET